VCPSVSLSVCPVDRQQQRRAAACLSMISAAEWHQRQSASGQRQCCDLTRIDADLLKVDLYSRCVHSVADELIPAVHPFNSLFSRTASVSRCQKGKIRLDLSETRDDGVLGCSGISWTICKQSAPHSRQITTPTLHHSIFTGRMLLLTPQSRACS